MSTIVLSMTAKPVWFRFPIVNDQIELVPIFGLLKSNLILRQGRDSFQFVERVFVDVFSSFDTVHIKLRKANCKMNEMEK